MITEQLPVQLTEVELRERGQKLAQLLEARDTEEVLKKAFDDSAKKKIESLEVEASQVARVIRAGQEDREVQIEEQKDYEAQEVRTIRLDTNVTVRRRAMTPRELQRPLPLDSVGKKKERKSETAARA